MSTTWRRLTVWVRVLTRSSRCSTIARRAVTAPSTAAEFNLACAARGDRHADGVGIVVLAAVAGGQHPYPGGEFGGNVEDVDPVGAQPGRQRRTQAGCAFDRPGRIGPPVGEAAQRTVAVAADWDSNSATGCSDASTTAAVQDALCGSIAITIAQGCRCR